MLRQEWGWLEAAGRPPVLSCGPAKLCPTCLAAPSPPLFSQTKDNYGKKKKKQLCARQADSTHQQIPQVAAAADWLGLDALDRPAPCPWGRQFSVRTHHSQAGSTARAGVLQGGSLFPDLRVVFAIPPDPFLHPTTIPSESTRRC